jgi:cytochrome c
MLDRQCVACHKPGTKGEKFDLTSSHSYAAMTG